MDVLAAAMSNERWVAKFRPRRASDEGGTSVTDLPTSAASLALTASNWVARPIRGPKSDFLHVQIPGRNGSRTLADYKFANDTMLGAGQPVRDGTDAAIVYHEPMKDAAAIDAFQALGQPTRLAALKLLVSAGSDGLSAGDLARSLGVQPSNATSHLNVLVNAGLAKSDRRGRHIYYFAERERIVALRSFVNALA